MLSGWIIGDHDNGDMRVLAELRAPQKRKKKKTASTASAARMSSQKALLAYTLFCGALLVTLTSFISLEFAALSFGFLVMMVLGVTEYGRRRQWERASDFKLHTLQKIQDNLTQDIVLTSEDIIHVKSSLEVMNARVEAIRKNTDYLHAQHNRIQGVYEALQGDGSEIETSTTATFRYTPRSGSTLIANDDPFNEHASLSDMVVQELVVNAVQKQRIDVFMQPIVRLPQRKAVAYELYARIRARAGLYVPAGRYMDLARKQNISNDIDNLLLLKCLDLLKSNENPDPEVPFFINIEPSTLKDRKFMRDLLAYVANNRITARKLVFEMRYSDFKKLPAPLFSIMDALAKLGCVFSLDHVNDLEFDTKTLLARHIRYIKMDGRWMTTHNGRDSAFTALWRTKQKLEANGIRVIAATIEHEGMLRDLMDYDLHFGQGYLFGKPDTPGAHEPFAYAKHFTKREGFKESFG